MDAREAIKVEKKAPIQKFNLKELESGAVPALTTPKGISGIARQLAQKLLPKAEMGVAFSEFVNQLMKSFPNQQKNVVYTQARQALLDHPPFVIRKYDKTSFLVRLKEKKKEG
jgi:hypothetical protein